MSARDGREPMSDRVAGFGWPRPGTGALARALDRWRRATSGRSAAPGRWGSSGAGVADAPVAAVGIGPPPGSARGTGAGGAGIGSTSSGGAVSGGTGAGDVAALAELARRLDDSGCAYGRVSAARLEHLTRAYDRLETKLNAVLMAAMGTFLSTLASLLLYYARGGAH